MLAFSNDYYGFIFRATQSVELFCAYFETDVFLEQMQSLMEAAYTNDEHIREKVAEIVTTYHPAGKNGSEEKGEVYERLLDQSAKTQELRQQKRNQILSEGQ